MFQNSPLRPYSPQPFAARNKFNLYLYVYFKVILTTKTQLLVFAHAVTMYYKTVVFIINTILTYTVTGGTIDATQEMLTLSLCNILGSFVQAMPTCGAFTRSAVASASGVRTPLAGLYSGTYFYKINIYKLITNHSKSMKMDSILPILCLKNKIIIANLKLGNLQVVLM